MKKNKKPKKILFPAKKILCATDLSEPSYEGVSAAAIIAETLPAELILIHIVPPVFHGGSTLVPAAAVLAKAAEAEEVYLIVIATHGWSGWRRFIFGSVAEKVVRLSTLPVLTIPEP